MPKKFLSVVLVCTFLFNMTGIFVLFRLEQARIRREIKLRIKAGIPTDELHVFDFSHEAFGALSWERKGREFRLGNELYDIVRTEKWNGGLRVFCIDDREESVLFASLDRLISKKIDHHSNDPHSPVQKALQWLKQRTVSSPMDWSPPRPFIGGTRLVFACAEHYSPPFFTPATPPPNTI